LARIPGVGIFRKEQDTENTLGGYRDQLARRRRRAERFAGSNQRAGSTHPTVGMSAVRRMLFIVTLSVACVTTLASAPSGSLGDSKLKPKPIRAALEARYKAISEAYRLRDPDTVLRLRTHDFRAVMPSGQVWDAATSAEYTHQGFAQVETTLVLSFGLGTIDVLGDTAAAEIDQHWVRRQRKAGALRLVDTRAHQRETWLRRGGGWLLWRVDHVAPGPWIVDGKRIDPNRPYDPNAPPWRGQDR
jgi:Domain of unknown function (DUF4440)